MKDNLRVWWGTSGKKLKHFYVKNVDDAKLIINALTIKEEDDESIEWNACGLEKMNVHGLWEEYYDENGLNIEEIMDEEYEDYDYMFRGE